MFDVLTQNKTKGRPTFYMEVHRSIINNKSTSNVIESQHNSQCELHYIVFQVISM